RVIPVSPVTLWRMVKRGEFPPPSFITPNKKVWFEDKIVAWQANVNGRTRGRRNRRKREAAPLMANTTAKGKAPPRERRRLIFPTGPMVGAASTPTSSHPELTQGNAAQQ